MSLLMDALRRAEAEKKHAAARDDGLSIDLPERSGEMRLEPLETSTERPMRVLDDDDTRYDDQAAPTRQQFTRPGAGREASGAGDEPNPFLTAPAGPGSAAQPTVVTAQTVFEATRGGGIPRALIAIIVCTVLLAAGLTAVGVYAYRQTPAAHEIPSPRVAALSEAPRKAPPPVPASPPAPSAAPAPVAATPMPAPEAAPVPEAAPTVAAAPPPVAASAPPSSSLSTSPSSATPAAPTPAVAPVRAPPLAATLAVEIPRDAEIASGEVRIAKRTTPVGEADEVTRAYAAFQLGKLDVAGKLYRRALAAEPDRLDALLGLAAVAMRENRLADAHRLYREVLEKSPRHPVASAALFMIEGADGSSTNEARLKLLADRDADSPYLKFALGNLYAKQKRWADAQAAYFAAYSRAPANADYAYNLAVSLDQLGQRKAALEYYRKALSLRAPGAAFDATRAHGRVAALVGAP